MGVREGGMNSLNTFVNVFYDIISHTWSYNEEFEL